MTLDIQTSSSHIRSNGDMASFASTAEPVLSRLHQAVAELVRKAPAPVSKAKELQRLLEVDASLGWQTFRLSQASEPFGAAPFVPGPGSMERLLMAARAHGFNAKIINRIETAYAEFVELVEQTAGGRRAFDAMIAALGRESSDQVDLKDRRSHFRTSGRLWGFEAKAKYSCTIRHALQPNIPYDALAIQGLLGVRQFRPVPPITVLQRTRAGFVKQNSETKEVFEQEATNLSVLDDFCSHPTPRLEVVVDKDTARDTLLLDKVGKGTAVDCFASDIVRSMPQDFQDLGWSDTVKIYVPCETAFIDMLLPKGWADITTLGVEVFGNAFNVSSPRPHLMPFKESALHLGNEIEALSDPLTPRAPEMIRHLLRHYGWNRAEFDVFRCKVRYPMMHTHVSMFVDGKRPGADGDAAAMK